MSDGWWRDLRLEEASPGGGQVGQDGPRESEGRNVVRESENENE